MHKKASGLIILISLLAVFGLKAQNLTTSPYSFVGIGEIQFGGSAWMSAMGQINQGFVSPYYINNQNPASYNALQLTIWEAGGTGAFGSISSATNSFNTTRGSFAYLAMGMPISQKRRWGMSFGLMPYSSSGFNINRTLTTETFTGTEQIESRGGTSKFYIGTGLKVYKNLSAGINLAYLFGQTKQTMLLLVPREFNISNQVSNLDYFIGDASVDLGLQYADTFKYKGDRYQWSAGATYTPSTELSATRNYNVRTLGVGVVSPSLPGKDTILLQNDQPGNITMPQKIQLGFVFQKVDHWMLAADIQYNEWQKFRSFDVNNLLVNNLCFGVGASITPNASDFKNYLKRIEYRGGFRYDNGNIQMNNQRISSYSISAGLGLPLGKSKSRLNISGEYFVRGTTASNLVKEELYRITVGVVISDRWFLRYRYD
jgi:hypothetical protein